MLELLPKAPYPVFCCMTNTPFNASGDNTARQIPREIDDLDPLSLDQASIQPSGNSVYARMEHLFDVHREVIRDPKSSPPALRNAIANCKIVLNYLDRNEILAPLAQVSTSVGTAFNRLNEHRQALRYHSDAHEIFKELYCGNVGPRSRFERSLDVANSATNCAETLMKIGDQKGALAHSSAAIKRFEDMPSLREHAEHSHSDYCGFFARSLFIHASILMKSDRFPAASHSLERSLELLKSVDAPRLKSVVAAALERAKRQG